MGTYEEITSVHSSGRLAEFYNAPQDKVIAAQILNLYLTDVETSSMRWRESLKLMQLM